MLDDVPDNQLIKDLADNISLGDPATVLLGRFRPFLMYRRNNRMKKETRCIRIVVGTEKNVLGQFT